MDRFVANFTLRLDSKGRVSIPGAFRAVLVRDGFEAKATLGVDPGAGDRDVRTG